MVENWHILWCIRESGPCIIYAFVEVNILKYAIHFALFYKIYLKTLEVISVNKTVLFILRLFACILPKMAKSKIRNTNFWAYPHLIFN